MRGAKLKSLVIGEGVGLLAIATVAVGAPVGSDGTYYDEPFSGTTSVHPSTSAMGLGAHISDGIGHITTSTGTEGVIRAGQNADMTVPGNSEYVIEFDFKLNATGATGDSYEMLRPLGPSNEVDIVLNPVADLQAGTWDFRAIDANGAHPLLGLTLALDEFHHVVVHHTNVNNEIDVWVGDTLVGTFIDRVPGEDIKKIQWGDPSIGFAFGDISIDNISIGNAIPVPEPAIAGFIGLGGLLAMCRRRS